MLTTSKFQISISGKNEDTIAKLPLTALSIDPGYIGNHSTANGNAES